MRVGVLMGGGPVGDRGGAGEEGSRSSPAKRTEPLGVRAGDLRCFFMALPGGDHVGVEERDVSLCF